MSISLQSLLVPSQTVEVDFPEKPGLKVKIAFLSREELIKLRKNCITTKFDRKARQPVEELDEDLFLKNYVSNVIKGWSGFKYKYLQDLMVVDLSIVKDLEDELEYNQENALVLMKNSTEFDSFVTDVTSDLSNFTKYSSRS
jgi:hypothetical protein